MPCGAILLELLTFFTLKAVLCNAFGPKNALSIKNDRPVSPYSRIAVGSYCFGATTASGTSFELVQSLTEASVLNCSLDALQELGGLCQQRVPYGFRSQRHNLSTLVAHYPSLLPDSVIKQFREKVSELERNGWLSTNMDSVDGLPSLHMNLVSYGVPMHERVPEENKEFGEGIKELLHLVEPYVYERLLPGVQAKMNDTTIEVMDIFLRRYGSHVGVGNPEINHIPDVSDKSQVDNGWRRTSISAHYDVYSLVTSVIALDDTAKDGQNGLYTSTATSNHAALRRFFPLKRGDAVIHTWDVLHGVDIEEDLDRTSLIVWYSSGKGNAEFESNTISSDQLPNRSRRDLKEEVESKSMLLSKYVSGWLLQRQDLATNDIAQFVLASALASIAFDENVQESDKQGRLGKTTTDFAELQHALYLESAMKLNTFALTRMGSLCEEGALSDELLNRSTEAMREIRPSEPFDVYGMMSLAQKFWLEAALRGNLLAQQTLAGDLMYEASSTEDANVAADLRHTAAILFALAAQQGNGEAYDYLHRVLEVDLEARQVNSPQGAMESPVFQVMQAALLT